MSPENPLLSFFLSEIRGIYGNREVGPKIASLYSSMIGTHGFRGDLIAIIMPASVWALLLLVYAGVCVHVRMAALSDLWIRQILRANNGALCRRLDYSPGRCQLNKPSLSHAHTHAQRNEALPLLNLLLSSVFFCFIRASATTNISHHLFSQLQNFKLQRS